MLSRIARILFEAWWTPLIRIGVIHGDPHLGNYSFTDGAGRLNLLDFGCIRVFPPAFVGGVVKLFRAMVAGDRAGEAAAYRAWGFAGLTDDLMDVLGIWARFIYGPLLDDRVRTVADGVSPGARPADRDPPRARRGRRRGMDRHRPGLRLPAPGRRPELAAPLRGLPGGLFGRGAG